jgi:hypothetical protein
VISGSSLRQFFRGAVSTSVYGGLGLIWFLTGSIVAAGSSQIECPDHGQPIPVDNAQVLQWKKTTANQFLARAHVDGRVSRTFSDRSGHKHFEIKLGEGSKDILEVVYNSAFGELPPIQSGMNVEACGDYITSVAQAGPYPPSPSGAIIHWVHLNPSGHGHDSGFLIIDGVVYGQEIPLSGPRKSGNGRRPHADPQYSE